MRYELQRLCLNREEDPYREVCPIRKTHTEREKESRFLFETRMDR